MADEDFDEAEIWSFVLKERKEASPSLNNCNSITRRAKDRSTTRSHERQSDPVRINIDVNANANGNSNCNEDNDDNDDDDDDDEVRVPPHEWIAKKQARSEISSFSVCEGAGRTLKGRDQRKVRNAVLKRTGFLE